MSDLLFEITESRLAGAMRWQKRALAAESNVGELKLLLGGALIRLQELGVTELKLLDQSGEGGS